MRGKNSNRGAEQGGRVCRYQCNEVKVLAYLQGRLHCSQAGVLLGGLPVQQPHDTLLVTVVLALLLQKTSHALSSMPHAQLCYKDFVQHLYNMCPQQAKQLNSTPYNSRQTASRGHAQAGVMVGTEHVGSFPQLQPPQLSPWPGAVGAPAPTAPAQVMVIISQNTFVSESYACMHL